MRLKFHGSGGLFVIQNLFSKLKGTDYINIFKKYNLKVKFLAVEFCPLGYELIKNKEIKKKIFLKNKNINIEDCYLKSHIIYLQKKMKKKFFLIIWSQPNFYQTLIFLANHLSNKGLKSQFIVKEKISKLSKNIVFSKM